MIVIGDVMSMSAVMMHVEPLKAIQFERSEKVDTSIGPVGSGVGRKVPVG